MKGLIFTGFLEMVERDWSPEMADRIIEESDLASGGAYTVVGTYPTSEMTALVGALSGATGIPVPDLLRGYGRDLFPRLAERYGVFVASLDNALDFVGTIDSLHHAEVRKLYPDAELPSFDVQRISEHETVLAYSSPRRLGDLAEGLLWGVVDYFAEKSADVVTVARADDPADPGTVRFTLTRMAAGT